MLTLLIISSLIAVSSIVLLIITKRRITSSLKRINHYIEEIGNGNLSINIKPSEIKGPTQKIALSLKDLAEKLKATIKHVSHEKTELKAVLSAMNEGVMLISSDGNVAILNDALKGMFEISSEENSQKPYWEVLRNNDVTKLIEQSLTKRIPLKKEISILFPTEKYYLLNAIPLDSPEKELIVVTFDITDFKRLERIKADFIANVSHELRTPLTAIKGYTETLEDETYGSPEERRHFLEIIKRHTDRLITMVSDLLVLSEVENRDYSWKDESERDFEGINLKEIVLTSFDALRTKALEKNLNMNIDIKEDLSKSMGNRFLLEQMFINLIDNSIKYTPEGGTIGVQVTTLDSKFKIEVYDTGIGIPKEYLPRIFERFYRIDKTRSRKLGGTGLGLSIVKHITIMHSGKIEVESEEGKGSRFIITLPLLSHSES